MGLSQRDSAAIQSWERREPSDPRYYVCEGCEGEVSAADEVQCQHCGTYRCADCDLGHSCPGSNTCTACDKRLPTVELKLTPCSCDEELCPGCYAAHICPPTLSQGMDALVSDLAEGLVR